MAASINKHVSLCYGRYLRVFLQTGHFKFALIAGHTSCHTQASFPVIWSRYPLCRRCYSRVTCADEGGGRSAGAPTEGDHPGSASSGSGPGDHGAEKRRLMKTKKEAKKQHALENQRLKQAKKAEKKSVVYEVYTEPGQKKDVTVPLPDAYSPEYVEAAWYDWWQQEGFFKPDSTAYKRQGTDQNERFVVCLPPPNVTGTLHLGHALGNSIQDALSRWHRMCGHEVLWVPGMDHAGIATQVVVEKKLSREKGLSRHQLGRKAFVEEVWKWKTEKGGVISDQMRRLGSSLDWSREFFTLDPAHSKAVREAFIRLHDRGLIHRKERLVNWSCSLKSAISDIEVDSLSLEKKTYLNVPGYEKRIPFGELTSFAYPVDGSDEEVVVSTTRLETMLGDTAVAVHPEDARFSHLHGRRLLHPLTGRALPVVCDHMVQREYGSGAVKITPGHDQNDYDLGQRHDLPLMNIMDDSGRLINVPEPFEGMPRFEARHAVLNSLKEKNLYRGSKDNPMVLPMCSRSGDVIEPLLKDQWFMDCSDMARGAVQAVKSGELELIPDQYEAHWFEWLKEPRDWCISRQLWWGHRIPAYRVDLKSDKPLPPGTSDWVSAHSETDARRKAASTLGVSEEDIILTQDEDVLDTWFSSAIVPFSAMGWPDQSADLDRYYPTDLLETASDILFFWVARMVMVGQTLTGQLPFNKVLLHSILRDSHGRKMSKSLGNIVDPMDVITGITLDDLQTKLNTYNLSEAEVAKAKEGQKKDFPLGISECGTDALRFTMCSYNYKNQYVNVDVNHMAANRRFCNKVWQAFKFCSGQWGSDYVPPSHLQLTEATSSTDRWVLSQLSELVARCQQGFETYSLNQATAALYNFWWLRFCDIYLEYSKTVLHEADSDRAATAKDILHLCVSTGLRALSPFMPFLTEELYQRLPGVDLCREPSVTLATYPRPEQFPWKDPEVDQDMVQVQVLINQILSLRKDFSIGKAKQEVILQFPSETIAKTMGDYAETLQVLSRSSSVVLTTTAPQVTGYARHEVGDGSVVYIKLAGLIDRDIELQKFAARRTKLQEDHRRLEERQTKASVPEHIRIIEKEKLNKVSSDLKRVLRAMEILEELS